MLRWLCAIQPAGVAPVPLLRRRRWNAVEINTDEARYDLAPHCLHASVAICSLTRAWLGFLLCRSLGLASPVDSKQCPAAALEALEPHPVHVHDDVNGADHDVVPEMVYRGKRVFALDEAVCKPRKFRLKFTDARNGHQVRALS